MSNILCFGELLLRLSPQLGGEWIKQASMPAFIGGAELNVARALARWKVPVSYCTALPDHYLSREILSFIEENGVDTARVHFSGSRIGTYYLPQGADLKSAGVIYDRAYSSFWELEPGQINWDKVLEGITWLHFSAISPALNQQVADVCLEVAKAAAAKGITVSVDLNYRAKLWQYGKKPVEVMPALVEHCDVVMGNIWAANTMLGTAIDENIHEDSSREKYLRHAKQTSEEIMRLFPKAKLVANTFRFDGAEESIIYYTSLYTKGEQFNSEEYTCHTVVDRSGSGDCYMAGLILGATSNLPPQEMVELATAAAFGKLQEKGDATNQTILSIYQNMKTGLVEASDGNQKQCMQLSKKTFAGHQEYPEKVLQFGEGNFLRCFVDWMFHQLNKKGDFNGSVVAVQPIEKGMVNLLNEQDGLYTVYLRGLKDGKAESTHETVDVISRGINPYEDFNAYLKTAENPDMRYIISNTTEAGITYSETDSATDTPPASFPAKLALWLHHRYQTFKGDESKGVHVIPCELIEKNADNLKRVLLQLAQRWNYEQGFIEWLNTACTFSNTLVDRIVPGYPKERIAEITEELGYEDKQVVEGEPFHLWVIEAPESLQNELPFPSIGLDVLYVKDITPYRTRKVRILNGAHTTLVPVAYLYGIDTVREAVEDPVVGSFLRAAIYEEIIPTLDLPKEELEQFAADVIDRFRNPFIKHQLMSIALNSWSKFETRVLPSILEYQRRTGNIPQHLAFSLAATIAFYKGKRGEESIALNDDAEVMALLKNAWEAADGSEASIREVVVKVLSYETNWKMDLNRVEGLTAAVTQHLINIEKNGMQAAIQLTGKREALEA